MKNIFFDLDGTLLDPRKRIFQLFIDLTGTDYTFGEYWKLKRKYKNNSDIIIKMLKYSSLQVENFQKRWRSHIETKEYLDFDKLFSYTISTLTDLKTNGYCLWLVTNRRIIDETIRQTDSMKISHFFYDILATAQKNKKGYLIKSHVRKLNSDDYFVSDHASDICEGKAINIRTAGVLSGVSTINDFKKVNPYILTDNIETFYLFLRDDKVL